MKYVMCRREPTLGDKAFDWVLGWPLTAMGIAAAGFVLGRIIWMAFRLWN